MAFVFITGPMKSGKSLELIARVEPFKFAGKKIVYLQPKKNVREANITSRLGVDTEALVVSSLVDAGNEFDVVGIDEIHMFDEGDVSTISAWLKEGKSVFVSGFDTDYRGLMPPIVKQILEMKPDVFAKQAVCDVCQAYDARFSQILENGEPVTEGLPLITPDDGTYQYEARCRDCFVKN